MREKKRLDCGQNYIRCRLWLPRKRQIQQTFSETALKPSGAKTQTIKYDLVCTEVKNCSSGRGGSSFC